MAAIAALLFFLYRRVKRKGSLLGSRRNQKPWQSANLHGPRRFFGLFADRSQVQPKTRKETAWEIDGNDTAQGLYSEVGGDRGSTTSFHTAQSHQPIASHMTGHSRTESTTSLITNGSRQSSRSFLGALASKFSSKAYQSGTAKGPGYRRIQVVSANANQQFKIDGSPARINHFTFPPAPERDDSLSSVLDIRRPSTSHRPSNTGSQEDSFPPLRRFTGDAEGPASDFSLATSDLVTPISPESGENEIVGVRFSLSCRQGVI